ncbi:Trehalase-like Protein [Tribolium castaneum]|uniref:Trehalase n=1 Tax=Tribolium castaneum TaxID=7070 RepID=D7EKX5_TRICA|nr:Trehalase-like Protein [Tribolium castaneum]
MYCACKSPIFCQGDLLRVVQMVGIFKDSKTFVDMSLVRTMEKTLNNFEIMMTRTGGSPNKNDVVEFIQKNFQASHNELDNWYPTDYQVNPPFLRKIKDVRIRAIAKKLLDIWPNLGRKIKPEVMQNPSSTPSSRCPMGLSCLGGGSGKSTTGTRTGS